MSRGSCFSFGLTVSGERTFIESLIGCRRDERHSRLPVCNVASLPNQSDDSNRANRRKRLAGIAGWAPDGADDADTFHTDGHPSLVDAWQP